MQLNLFTFAAEVVIISLSIFDRKEGQVMEDITRRFTVIDSKTEMREILSSVYNSLKVKGYNPINQLVGYILSEDPTYITNYNNARSLICRIDRDELMHELLINYLGKDDAQE